jgi:hypothetical protein
VAWAGDETDTEPLEVVKWIVESVDLELASVTRPCIDVADAKSSAEDGTDPLLERVADA